MVNNHGDRCCPLTGATFPFQMGFPGLINRGDPNLKEISLPTFFGQFSKAFFVVALNQTPPHSFCPGFLYYSCFRQITSGFVASLDVSSPTKLYKCRNPTTVLSIYIYIYMCRPCCKGFSMRPWEPHCVSPFRPALSHPKNMSIDFYLQVVPRRTGTKERVCLPTVRNAADRPRRCLHRVLCVIESSAVPWWRRAAVVM